MRIIILPNIQLKSSQLDTNSKCTVDVDPEELASWLDVAHLPSLVIVVALLIDAPSLVDLVHPT